MSSIPNEEEMKTELNPITNLEKWKAQQTAELEEWKVKASYDLEFYKQKENYHLEHHKIIVTLGQNACKAIFLLAAGGCVALLSYIAQAKQATPSTIFTALKLFSASALIATFLSGFAYFEIYFMRSTRLLVENISNETKKKKLDFYNEVLAYFLDFIAIILWLSAFALILYAALTVCPTLTAATFTPKN